MITKNTMISLARYGPPESHNMLCQCWVKAGRASVHCTQVTGPRRQLAGVISRDHFH